MVLDCMVYIIGGIPGSLALIPDFFDWASNIIFKLLATIPDVSINTWANTMVTNNNINYYSFFSFCFSSFFQIFINKN